MRVLLLDEGRAGQDKGQEMSKKSGSYQEVLLAHQRQRLMESDPSRHSKKKRMKHTQRQTTHRPRELPSL